MDDLRILSGEEKGEISNYLYNYVRADTAERGEFVRTLLFSYIERLLNKEVPK
jgi:hypothetical protein